MLLLIIFGVLILIMIIIFILLLVNLVLLLIRKVKKEDLAKRKETIKKNMIIFSSVFIITIGVVALSQLLARTPEITVKNNENSKSISELKKVNLNGRDEWISIRGQDRTKPIILFLAGGPGGSQMAAVRHNLAKLEKSFVVVNWDQPGSGKSYSAIKPSSLTKVIYVEDGVELTKYLLDEFKQDKIYLIGESWGSALGIFMVGKSPELYHAFIGTGQMVAFLETEIIDYNLALDLAKKANDNKLITELKENGAPPYYGSDVTWKSLTYLNYLNGAMGKNPQINNSGFNTIRDIASSEYGIIDKINYARGLLDVFTNVYPQLYNTDLRKDYPKLAVPVYFFLGKHDVNAPLSLANDYFNLLEAPKKEQVWFEHSGHNPWINESDKFVDELVKRFSK